MSESNDGGPGVPVLTWVVARAENGVIGRDGGLPWRQPADLAFFKRVTMGKPVIMGRTTWQSIGRPLPGRANIVVSRSKDFEAPGATVVTSLDSAMATGMASAVDAGADEVAIIGGAQIYATTKDRVARLYLTVIHDDIAGDTTLELPDLSTGWVEMSREFRAADKANPLPMSFVIYDRA